MTRETLPQGLDVFRCPDTKGIFIPAANYWRWLQQQPERLTKRPPDSDATPTAEETSGPKVCPESGALMLRYKVGHGFDFFVDRSPTGGIWLDSGEWEALRERQFHDELHLIFTAPWQRTILESDIEARQAERLATRLGSDLVEQLDALSKSLEDHPDRAFALAYLNRAQA